MFFFPLELRIKDFAVVSPGDWVRTGWGLGGDWVGELDVKSREGARGHSPSTACFRNQTPQTNFGNKKFL